MMQLRQIWARFLSIYICHLNLNFLSGILIFFFGYFVIWWNSFILEVFVNELVYLIRV